jgi:acyl-CoA dehydrogenase
MSAARGLLVDTANSVFDAVDPAQGFTACWSKVADAGFALLLVPEAAGGFGGDAGDLFAILRVAGARALALPVGETIVAMSMLAEQAPLDRALSFTDRHDGRIDGERYTGVLGEVPFGRHVAAVVVRAADRLLYLNTCDAEIVEAYSVAGEPRDTLRFSNAPAQSSPCTVDLRRCGAFLRVAQSAGALDRALEMTIEHANARQQFGKPLAKLQAVQQSLAVFAVEAAAANSAGEAAAAALDHGDASFEIAAAKLRTNQAIGIGTATAHQVHGGIGFTQEYPLHLLTRRLMGWRSEFGNDAFWAAELGGVVAALGAEGLWAEIARRGDRS